MRPDIIGLIATAEVIRILSMGYLWCALVYMCDQLRGLAKRNVVMCMSLA